MAVNKPKTKIMFTKTTTTLVSIFITLATLCGVTLHENKLDKLMTAVVGYSALTTTHEVGAAMRGDAHTHVERVSVKSAFGNSVPTNRLRQNEFKQYLMRTGGVQGHHPFDNYLLPLYS